MQKKGNNTSTTSDEPDDTPVKTGESSPPELPDSGLTPPTHQQSPPNDPRHTETNNNSLKQKAALTLVSPLFKKRKRKRKTMDYFTMAKRQKQQYQANLHMRKILQKESFNAASDR